MANRYPIYIPSKGRHDLSKTAAALDRMGASYRIVVEEDEWDAYRVHHPEDRLLRLPFSNLGQGSIPARNWIWEHAISEGHGKHWCIDDNIREFYRLNHNRRRPAWTTAVLRAAEDFTDRFSNVALSGLNNIAFANDRSPRIAPFTLNTRIYSCSLIRNDIPFRWRGRLNEDTDLCLRVMKAGWATIQFNAFLIDKATTMVMRGGNTDTVYATGDNRRAFAESLTEQHPDVVRVTWKFGRWHHQVDYSPFAANDPRLRDDIEIPDTPNEYGMALRRAA